MKTLSILSILTFLLVANQSFSQASVAVAKVDKKMITDSPVKVDKKSPASPLEHSQTAVLQVKTHIIENVVYPKQMMENSIEGQVVVKVLISETGKIKGYQIEKSPNKAFDEAVLKAMKAVKVIKVNGKQYKGVNTIYVPINFSLGL